MAETPVRGDDEVVILRYGYGIYEIYVHGSEAVIK